MARVAVIGAGFSGLSAASILAQAGMEVTVLEKHDSAGGRARKFEAQGFTFDMGPSWYWMPDVFEKFFGRFGKSVSDYYDLIRLDPSYRIVFGPSDTVDVPAGIDALRSLFESIEPGSAPALDQFLRGAETKYDIAMKEFVYQPGLSLSELLRVNIVSQLPGLDIFSSIRAVAQRHFKSKKLQQIIEFPALFLGATPAQIPALYSLMNYADMSLGTWYPQGGMYQLVQGMEDLARSLGVDFQFNSEVTHISTGPKGISHLTYNAQRVAYDYVVASADYHHVEQELLPLEKRRYDEAYWESRTMAPSCLIYYLGVNRKVEGLLHHNLFFDTDFDRHAHQIYREPAWPSAPQFYVCCPSKTDSSVAPPGAENIFILIPTAPGLSDSAETRRHYFDLVLQRMKSVCDLDRQAIVYQRSYAHADFSRDYHAYKGQAYGLANTLRQTANLKPSIVNKKVPNLFYTGQLTVPGPGVPPALISGQVVADQLLKSHHKLRRSYEGIV